MAETAPDSGAIFVNMLIRRHITSMTTALTDRVGFSHPTELKPEHDRRSRAFAELITTAALAVSLVIAVVAVSIGISRASTRTASIEIDRVL